MMVGPSMAERFGREPGDQVSIINARMARAVGSEAWNFLIAGAFEGATAQIDRRKHQPTRNTVAAIEARLHVVPKNAPAAKHPLRFSAKG